MMKTAWAMETTRKMETCNIEGCIVYYLSTIHFCQIFYVDKIWFSLSRNFRQNFTLNNCVFTDFYRISAQKMPLPIFFDVENIWFLFSVNLCGQNLIIISVKFLHADFVFKLPRFRSDSEERVDGQV